MLPRPYKIFLCPGCGRRRGIHRRSDGDLFHYCCSQGHQWTVPMGTLDRITKIQMTVILPALREAMLYESPLLKRLRR